ncbi:MAG: hypothetical protein Q9170_006370 [Blastenia crenularia]
MLLDPVSAFSLAAGVLQTVDVGTRVLSMCHEIYKDGSLAEYRDSEDITQQLLETTRYLEESLSILPVTTRDLKGGFRQSVGKSIRALRKQKSLAEIQNKLDRYREVLNTRILSKLDFHALQHIENYNKLDQRVRDLAVALSEGRDTYEQLLAAQTTLIKEHIDRHFNDKAHQEASLKTQQRFKDSLFCHEIFARQDDVARSHEGTCCWIFGPAQAWTEQQSVATGPNVRIQHKTVEEIRAQPWSNFKDWLEGESNDPYWLSGKPGSGKSTLMKYISTEFSSFHKYIGDEDHLIGTIHLLSHASGTKVCASSRPEQIFRQGFEGTPKLRLQDLNEPDIYKATAEQLIPILEAHVACAQYLRNDIIQKVAEKAQGIFLWAALMTKDLKRGARNADSIEELQERLQRTPETIDGLYEHLVSRLDKGYRRDAARYFYHLLFHDFYPEGFWSRKALPANLLEFACMEEDFASYQTHKDPESLEPSMVQHVQCRKSVHTSSMMYILTIWLITIPISIVWALLRTLVVIITSLST